MEDAMKRRWTFGALTAVLVGVITALVVADQQHAERQTSAAIEEPAR
jgi:hypothetical protein